jgi:hypothetical protein
MLFVRNFWKEELARFLAGPGANELWKICPSWNLIAEEIQGIASSIPLFFYTSKKSMEKDDFPRFCHPENFRNRFKEIQ